MLVLHSITSTTSVVCVALGLTFAEPRSARADDLFETQVFHVRVNEPGQFGAELHSNYVASGAAREPPELSPNHVLYKLIEPTFGLTKYWEVGDHFQQAVRPTGLDWGGAKLRTMVIISTPETFPLKLGVNFEGGYTPPAYDPGTWVFEIRPIAEWRLGELDIDVNPIVDFNFQGSTSGVPRFEPAAAARYTVLAYGWRRSRGGPGHRRQQGDVLRR
jgi:hypothetical protein